MCSLSMGLADPGRVKKEAVFPGGQLLVEGGQRTGFCRGIRGKAVVGGVLNSLQDMDRGEKKDGGGGSPGVRGGLSYKMAEAPHACGDVCRFCLKIAFAVICSQSQDG